MKKKIELVFFNSRFKQLALYFSVKESRDKIISCFEDITEFTLVVSISSITIDNIPATIDKESV